MARLYYVEDKDVLKRESGLPWMQFPDFGGKKGIPSFVLAITPEKAEELAEAGFNVKHYINRDKDYEIDEINIKMRYDNYPPKIYKYLDGTRNRVKLDEETLGDLQNDLITKIECSLSLSSKGACYMDKGYFHIEQNPLSHYELDDYDEEE